MTKPEIQQRHQLGGIAPVLSDVASCMRESFPYGGQTNNTLDAVQAARQLGRHEAWLEAAKFVQEIHVAPTKTEQKPVVHYSQPANPQPTDKQ